MTDFDAYLRREHGLTVRQFNRLSDEQRIAIHGDWMARGRPEAPLHRSWGCLWRVIIGMGILALVGMTRAYWA